MRPISLCRTALILLLAAGCGSGEEEEDAPEWQVAMDHVPGALLSLWGASDRDVWAVGADAGDGSGPTVLRQENGAFSRIETGETSGDLWWVFGFDGGPVFLGGSGGTILRYADGAFERMITPGTGVVFGLWGASPSEMWAVGGEAGGAQGAFAWRLEGDAWTPAPGFPDDLAATDALWKVFGRSASDVWMVGTGGKMLHYDGAALSPEFAGLSESLFTVHASSQRFAAVGGFGTGLLLEHPTGTGADVAWSNVSPAGAPSLIGVCLGESAGYAVGEFGYIAERGASGQWSEVDTGLESVFGVRSLHSVWIDPAGGVWAAGGQVRVPPLLDGILLHRGTAAP